jgi:uncharacterized membrane protein YccF (DUF307 family)
MGLIKSKLERGSADPETAARTHLWVAFLGFALAAVFIVGGVAHALTAATLFQSILGILLAVCSWLPALFGIVGVLAFREQRAKKRSELSR